MKNMKKLASLILALVMVLSLATTAFATTITVTGTGDEFKAYKLLNATNAVGADGKATDKYAYTLNEKYTSVLQSVTGKTTQEEIIAYIAALKDNADGIRTFADAVYAKVKSMDADYTTTTKQFVNVDQGYYLIAETKTTGTEDTYSLVMLNTAGVDNVTVTTKEDAPEVTKKIVEGEVSQDAIDKALNENVNFEITGTVSSKYADYETYYYSFVDTMSPGLTYNKDAKVFISDVEVTGQFTVTETNAEDGTTTITITCNDLKKLTSVTVTADSKIVVKYSAKLNQNAVQGQAGNPNKVILKYNNDPYYDGTGTPTTGETPEDKVTVFTFQVVVNKVDDQKQALKGAGFTLYKKNGESWVAVGEELKGENLTTFTFKNLDEGTYKLVETTVPAGYNKADDVIFEIDATYDTTSDNPQLTDLVVKDEQGNTISCKDQTFTITLADGKAATDVVNKAGSVLPSTGGMGTTLFYTLGGILMLAAVVLLVTKKRMNMAE